MLFIESKTSLQPVDSATRLLLLDNLEAKGLSLVRRMRLDCYQQVLMSQEGDLVMSHLDEMEQEIAAWCESEEGTQYVRGELFCHDDYVLFLLFVNADDEPIGVRAGIVYSHRTSEPMRELESFCREVRDSLKDARLKAGRGDKNGVMDFTEWRLNEQKVPASFKRFETQQDLEFLNSSARQEAAAERMRAAAMIEDPAIRMTLRKLKEASEEGNTEQLTVGRDGDSIFGSSVLPMTEAGLVKREVILSCRTSEKALFRLPSPEALAPITSSGATCSHCGRSLSDEKIDELLVPTELAAKLLEEGAWLSNHMRMILNAAGLPESQIAVGPSPGEGEAHMMANVHGQPFLFVMRDGDTNVADARRALDVAVETEASHLVVMCTGKIHDDARLRLREQARRRVRGSGLEVILLEGVDAPLDELQLAFDHVSQTALSEELFEMDSSLGFSAGVLVNTRFRLMQKTDGSYNRLRQVGALAEA